MPEFVLHVRSICNFIMYYMHKKVENASFSILDYARTLYIYMRIDFSLV